VTFPTLPNPNPCRDYRDADPATADARCDDCGLPIWTDCPWSFAEVAHFDTVTIYCEDCALYRGLETMA
jgi:hypothetical protein